MLSYDDVYNDLLKVAAGEPGLLFRSPDPKNDKSHDYDPNWDYEVDENPPANLARLALTASQQIYKELVTKRTIPDLMYGFEVWAVILDEKTVAMYINGTYDFPVILVDLHKHVNYQDQLGKSIRHELKHAAQQSEDRDFYEDEAEED